MVSSADRDPPRGLRVRQGPRAVTQLHGAARGRPSAPARRCRCSCGAAHRTSGCSARGRDLSNAFRPVRSCSMTTPKLWTSLFREYWPDKITSGALYPDFSSDSWKSSHIYTWNLPSRKWWYRNSFDHNLKFVNLLITEFRFVNAGPNDPSQIRLSGPKLPVAPVCHRLCRYCYGRQTYFPWDGLVSGITFIKGLVEVNFCWRLQTHLNSLLQFFFANCWYDFDRFHLFKSRSKRAERFILFRVLSPW